MGDSVLVIMSTRLSAPNKVHEKSFFGDIEILYIEDISFVEGDIDAYLDNENFRQMLLLRLSINCKANVIRAINHLQKINGIHYVGPSYIDRVGW